MSEFLFAMAFGCLFAVALSKWLKPSPGGTLPTPQTTTRQLFVYRVRGHSFVLVMATGSARCDVEAAVQAWVDDPELDFHSQDRDAVLNAINHATFPLKLV